MSEIGLKVKKLRLERGMSLKDFAEKTGLTASFLSQLENNIASPSIDSLRKIAEALGVSVGSLFNEVERKEFVFIRKRRDAKVFTQEAGANYEILASSLLDIRIYPMLLRLPRREQIEKDSCPQGEEMLGVCLKGQITVGVNDNEFVLEAFDSIYLVHPGFKYLKNTGEEEVVFLWNILRSGTSAKSGQR